MRRLRQYSWVRQLTQECIVTSSDFIYPLFVRDKELSPLVPMLPNVKRWLIDDLFKIADHIAERGIPLILLFPCSMQKSDDGIHALDPSGLIPQAIEKLKTYPFGIMTDIALDPYTSHGHDGILNIDRTDVDNEKTIKILEQQALLHASCGAHVVAPSDMMDGRIGRIRQTLNHHGYSHVLIFSYAAKFASALYAPFREAINIPHLQGPKDKKTYQLPISNRQEAMRCIQRDISEGADAIIIKPGCFYLDLIYEASQTFDIPIFAYQVSGEYAWLHSNIALLEESFFAFKRAGARGIITYGALDAHSVMLRP